MATASGCGDDLVFNVIDVFAEDFQDLDGDDVGQAPTSYVIKLFGRTAKGETVAVNVTGYTPHFYIRLPAVMSATDVKQFEKLLRDKFRSGFKSVRPMMKKDFWGFTNNATFPYLQMCFANHATMRRATYMFGKPLCVGTLFQGKPTAYRLYESNIEPFLRMFHKRDIEPCGWVRIPRGKYGRNVDVLRTSCAIDVNAAWTSLERHESPSIAPFRIASFDIECTSFDGQFPLATRDYKKLATNFLDEHASAIGEPDLGQRFADYFAGMFAGGKIRAKPGAPGSDRRELLALLRRHSDSAADILRGVSGLDEKHALKVLDPPRSFEDDDDAIVADFARKLQRMFPALEGDPIIQIGTTVHVYGEKQASERHVFVVGTCEPIAGARVHTFGGEGEMLVAWSKFLREGIDPDVLLGYNVMGFDFQYIVERADELGCRADVCTLGRVAGRVCPYRTKMLSSSALGDNVLKYIEIEGRVVVDVMKVVQRDHKLDSYKLDSVAQHFTGERKNDVSPSEIFRLHAGSAADRRRVAEYCIQDCALLNKLCVKLEILANNVGMSNVCCVPLTWIFMRGQGVKIFSLVSKQCKADDYMMPVVRVADCDGEADGGVGYEGAIVLDPVPGIYMDNPITVLDYASLYPSSMISENISHDTLVLDDKRYGNLPGVSYVDVVYDQYEGTGDKKVKAGERRCRYAESHQGVLPRILQHLLAQRKKTRKRMEHRTFVLDGGGGEVTGLVLGERDGVVTVRCAATGDEVAVPRARVVDERDTHDTFQKAVLDGLQLAYKVTANSLYGQVGARTSPIYLKDLAASTTATGRAMIMKAKAFIEGERGGRVIYGDTDSLFVEAPVGELRGVEAVKAAMDFGIAAQEAFKPHLKPPHDCEFEKVFYPFIIFSKKRYVGNVYDNPKNPSKFKMKSMGIVLRRRDNAPIVKTVYGGILDIILNQHDIGAATRFLRDNLGRLVRGEFPLEELVISKSLRANYKDPERIAHKVLAERMGERDPGNKPAIGDRVPYVYIKVDAPPKGVKQLQGDRIEAPAYVREHGLIPDYNLYIANQLSKPITQVFGLVVEQLPGYERASGYWDVVKTSLVAKNLEGDKLEDKLLALREDEAQRLLFEPVLVELGQKAKRRVKYGEQPADPAAKPPRKRTQAKKKTDGADDAASEAPAGGEAGPSVPKPKRAAKPKAAS